MQRRPAELNDEVAAFHDIVESASLKGTRSVSGGVEYFCIGSHHRGKLRFCQLGVTTAMAVLRHGNYSY